MGVVMRGSGLEIKGGYCAAVCAFTQGCWVCGNPFLATEDTEFSEGKSGIFLFSVFFSVPSVFSVANFYGGAVSSGLAFATLAGSS